MKVDLGRLRRWVTKAVIVEGKHLSQALCAEFGVSRTTAATHLKKLVKGGWLTSSGSTRPTYGPGRNREIMMKYPLPGITEDLIWQNDFRPWFDLSKNVAAILDYGFTEIMNNANDHSEGQTVAVLVSVRDEIVSLYVLDDGVGIFEKISKALDLPDRRLAILELSKGKFTTDPANHSGQGIFFTSRMFDQFQIEANGLRYDHDIQQTNDRLWEIDRPDSGTLIYMHIAANSQCTTKAVFDQFSGGEDYGFDKTIVPVKLARIGEGTLVSRSEAKRLVARFEGFKIVYLDFAGIEEIGQAFADEIFRVFKNAHPAIELVAINTTTAVRQMITRAQSTVGNNLLGL